MGGVSLLPQELGRAQEEHRSLFPAHDVGPLVDQQRQVAPRLDPLRVEVAEDRLTGRPNGQALLKLLAACMRHPGDLRREALDVLGLSLEEAFGDEQREIGVLVARSFEAMVQPGLHVLPEGEAVWADDHRAADWLEVVRQLRAPNGGGVPARECLALGGVLGRQLATELDLRGCHRVGELWPIPSAAPP